MKWRYNIVFTILQAERAARHTRLAVSRRIAHRRVYHRHRAILRKPLFCKQQNVLYRIVTRDEYREFRKNTGRLKIIIIHFRLASGKCVWPKTRRGIYLFIYLFFLRRYPSRPLPRVRLFGGGGEKPSHLTRVFSNDSPPSIVIPTRDKRSSFFFCFVIL